MTYEELLEHASKHCLCVEEIPLEEHDGLIINDFIAINKNLQTKAHKSCVLAEELAHYLSAVGDITDQTIIINRKAERKGRLIAYEMLVGIEKIIKAGEHGCSTIYEIADYLDVTEGFIKEAIEAYKSHYGDHVVYEDYVVGFVPHLYYFKKF